MRPVQEDGTSAMRPGQEDGTSAMHPVQEDCGGDAPRRNFAEVLDPRCC
jgi:hypothetical protein